MAMQQGPAAGVRWWCRELAGGREGERAESGVRHGICCVEVLQAEDRAWAGERVV